MRATVYPNTLKGEQVAPASKSSMQRACAAALLHAGTTRIFNPGHSNDDLAAIDVIQKLGATVTMEQPSNEKINGTSLIVHSNGVQPTGSSMNCGESGLGIRMFTPIAALSDQAITIEGKGSLLKRPMHFFDAIFPKIGIKIQSQSGYLPIQIKGPLKPANIEVDGSLSSQFLTGLLMAYAATDSTNAVIEVQDLKSKPYIDLTLSVLNAFGWNVQHQDYKRFEFLAHLPLAAHIDYTVEGDWSGAAFLLVAGAIAGPITVKGLQLDSTQADKAVLQALKATGASIEIKEHTIQIGPSKDSAGITIPLNAFEFDATDCPDLFPPLVALASVCDGITILHGVSRLAHKESDRGLTLQTEFAKLGIRIELDQDRMLVYGGTGIHGAEVFSQHDHRIAMACGVVALCADGPISITDAEAVNKSYTDFFKHLQHLGAKVDLDKIA
ncbi:MAG: 3-phosphoshikimate 1-carboxyvinyltransferase [Chitinophagaceae bacterium]|jgi:3-phosphoshikimate 1-carboxyvinyltransferase|nr:3-phosphoshikimate 1-carboxyvinyltransferase [Chitinophagaceae bacterium]MCF8289490.1 3-phosphoshikimate 1-carboxyvinyltransferase [Chitinophagaceae bacterium]MCF8421928.1 3-phosphoshikimate 1-carboxyvinyltransferase [Chitinophagaceae bacterium]